MLELFLVDKWRNSPLTIKLPKGRTGIWTPCPLLLPKSTLSKAYGDVEKAELNKQGPCPQKAYYLDQDSKIQMPIASR